MRKAKIVRKTTETDILLELALEGTGQREIGTGIGFFDHMLDLLAAHGRFDLTVRCRGDLLVDGHHTVEDIGIALGTTLKEALGDKGGITRYADITLPMDEALVLVALDISGRAHLSYGLELPAAVIGSFDTQLVEEFLLGLCRALGLTLHVRQLAGTNAHHITEALFKGLGRALARAVAQDPRLEGQVPSTKGSL